MSDILNPPAFPTETADRFLHGMTLRDWFASAKVAKHDPPHHLAQLQAGRFARAFTTHVRR